MAVPGLRFDQALQAILIKDLRCEFRSRYATGTLVMFALTTLASVSMATAGAGLTPEFAAALLWVVLFFCAMAGLARVFVQEQEIGTLLGLRLYASGQAVFCGKSLFNLLLLLGLAVLVVPLFVVFFNLEIGNWLLFSLTLVLGCIGMAVVATIMAVMVMAAQSKQAIFTVITFPILLPQFLSGVQAVSQVLAGNEPDGLVFMAGYDIAVIAAGLLLFDYLWND
jgi:heme exporter protein B